MFQAVNVYVYSMGVIILILYLIIEYRKNKKIYIKSNLS